MTATCTSCGGAYVEGAACPARGDGAHTRRRPALPASERKRNAIELKFSDDEVRALARLARRWRVTRTEAVRRAVAEALERSRRPTPEETSDD